MHQHPRPSPTSASPANSPRTNPMRTNNSRGQDQSSSTAGSVRGSTPSDQGSGMGEAAEGMLTVQEASTQSKDAVAKLSQILQNYFTKAALLILQSRVSLPPAYTKDTGTRRVNKWFNVEIDETDITRDDLRVWKLCDAIDNRPPPMIIEIYIDTQELTNNQSLVVVDQQGRRYDVEEALNASSGSSGGGNGQNVRPEVILERWVVQLGDPLSDLPRDLSPILPRTYKNAIVLYRSLYACARLLPAWRYGKRLFNSRTASNLPKLKYRILQDPYVDQHSKKDHLSIPLMRSREEVLGKFAFDPIDSPAGPMSIQVTYRNHCDFRIDDSEALLSSRFMGMDEQYFEPSLGRTQDRGAPRPDPYSHATEVGSLPQNRRDSTRRPDPSQAYGSLSTFHQPGPPTGTSPISALRAARVAGSQSPEDVMTRKAPPNTRSAQGSRSSLRSADGPPSVGRRPSVSFMPFKTPSLSASPSQADPLVTSNPRGSLGKASPLAALAEARAPSTLGPHGSVQSRASPAAPEQGTPSSISSSPKPAPPVRYSSSFGHRKAKLSTGGGSKTEDDNSSGKTSMSSAAQPGSGVLAEGGTSSGSVKTDDDNISDFLKMLDQKKDLKSFRSPSDPSASEASTRRTSAALNRYQRMRDTNRDLSESMSSSLMLHRSSSSSSRQLSNVPAMVAGASMSTSPSPSKPISPHTPHTPTIPSRLSANSVADYNNLPSQSSNAHTTRPLSPDENPRNTRAATPGAIDIPTSPRPFNPSYRRSSSAAQGPRAAVYDYDDPFPFGLRSISLGVEDRDPVNPTALAALREGAAQNESAVGGESAENRDSGFQPSFKPREKASEAHHRQNPSQGREEAESLSSRGAVYRPRIGRGNGRGDTPPQGSSSSLVDRGSGSGSSDQRGGRYSFSRPASTFEDEEPLLFAMSDFSATQQPRRSLEDTGAASLADRGGNDSSSSSRRGSRRGGY